MLFKNKVFLSLLPGVLAVSCIQPENKTASVPADSATITAAGQPTTIDSVAWSDSLITNDPVLTEDESGDGIPQEATQQELEKMGYRFSRVFDAPFELMPGKATALYLGSVQGGNRSFSCLG